jgi:hypothetical protein
MQDNRLGSAAALNPQLPLVQGVPFPTKFLGGTKSLQQVEEDRRTPRSALSIPFPTMVGLRLGKARNQCWLILASLCPLIRYTSITTSSDREAKVGARWAGLF